jgi:hypothetical protein
VNKEKPEAAESDTGPENADDDVVSDPAKSAGASGDWSDEGGATPSGPADTGDKHNDWCPELLIDDSVRVPLSHRVRRM